MSGEPVQWSLSAEVGRQNQLLVAVFLLSKLVPVATLLLFSRPTFSSGGDGGGGGGGGSS